MTNQFGIDDGPGSPVRLLLDVAEAAVVQSCDLVLETAEAAVAGGGAGACQLKALADHCAAASDQMNHRLDRLAQGRDG